MLTQEQIQVIERTRELVRQLELDTLTEIRYPYGRFGEACRAADDALHQVLLISQHWLGAEISDADREEEVV